MKVFAGLVAAVLGELVAPGEQWNGVPVDQGEEPEFNPLMRTIVKRPATNFCGMTFQGSSLVNRTCTIEADNAAEIYAGNGAFISGYNQVTGYEGLTGDLDLVIFFEQDCEDGACDNATCWDAQVDCEDNADNEAAPGVFFMETVNDGRLSPTSSQPTYNLQINGVEAGAVLTVSFNDWAAKNITAVDGIVDTAGSDIASTFTVAVNENFVGQLFQLQVTGANFDLRPLNLFASSVTQG